MSPIHLGWSNIPIYLIFLLFPYVLGRTSGRDLFFARASKRSEKTIFVWTMIAIIAWLYATVLEPSWFAILAASSYSLGAFIGLHPRRTPRLYWKFASILLWNLRRHGVIRGQIKLAKTWYHMVHDGAWPSIRTYTIEGVYYTVASMTIQSEDDVRQYAERYFPSTVHYLMGSVTNSPTGAPAHG